MTRKDYLLIAEVLRNEYRANGVFANKRAQDAIESLARGMAEALHSDNPRFDRDHFMAVARGEKELTSRPDKNAGAWWGKGHAS